MTATSDTSKPVSKRGQRELEVTLLYGGKDASKQAVKVVLTYDPEKKETWLKIIGRKHGTVENGKLIFDVSRQVLPVE
jgi:hypothetical protein